MKRDFNNKTACALLTLVAMSVSSAYAAIEIPWYTVDSGGVTDAAGDGFQLSATIGQHDAGAVMTGDVFELAGGFWASSGVGCFGDVDNDGEIGLSDLATLLAHYGETEGMTYADGDLDGDGDVDLADLATMLAVYGCGA